jgi:hypothetical protein
VPRYYFHLHDDVDLPDRDGTELPDRQAAYAQGLHCLSKFLAVYVPRHGAETCRVDVADEKGRLLFSLTADGLLDEIGRPERISAAG